MRIHRTHRGISDKGAHAHKSDTAQRHKATTKTQKTPNQNQQRDETAKDRSNNNKSNTVGDTVTNNQTQHILPNNTTTNKQTQ